MTGKAFAAPLKVFVSYAHEDEAPRKALANHLRALEREGLIVVWHDRKITGGREWAGAIDDALASADIVLLLISADFLASDYCHDVELKEASRLHDTGQARVVPVILRSCDWTHSPFARFNALPPDGLPVVEAQFPDQRYSEVADGLRRVVAELLPAAAAGAASPAGATPGAGAAIARPAKRRTFKIEFSLWGLKLGPLEVPVPALRGWQATLTAMAVLVLAAAAAYLFYLSRPMAQAREAMRMARYDWAVEQLKTVPNALAMWPGLSALRQSATLGASTYRQPQDWEQISADLQRQRKARPEDPFLQGLQAESLLRQGDYEGASRHVDAALAADPAYAQGWFLRGLIAEQAQGDREAALQSYRRAVDAAPSSPQYRGNLARTQLDLGRYDDALAEYAKTTQLPLAQVESALAWWAKGDFRRAADAQRAALAMLGNTEVMNSFYNRVFWDFVLSDSSGVRLPNTDDKRCYASLGEAASRRLDGQESVVFPPAACAEPPREIAALVADDLCRFVDGAQPGPAAATAALRKALRMPERCAPAAMEAGAAPGNR